MISPLQQYIETHRERLFDLLCELIRIPTENDGTRGAETPLAEYLQQLFAHAGVGSELYCPGDLPEVVNHPDYHHGRSMDGRCNITACLPGAQSCRSLMLAAHLDTVPVGDAALWTVPPLTGLRRDGRIYGRGANDDKHALAIMVFLAEAMKDLGIRLNHDLYFTGYVDEEFGGGNGALAACVKYPCDFYVNMDCQDLQIWNCATGGQRLAICLRHPQPQNSCEKVLDGLFLCKQRIDAFGQRRKAELADNPLYQGSAIPSDALRYMAIGSGLNTNDKHMGLIDFAFYTDRPREEIQAELDVLFDSIRRDIAPLGLELERVIYRSRFFPYGFTTASHREILRLQRTCCRSVNREATVAPSCLSDLSLFLSCAPGRAVSFGGGRDFTVPGGAHLPDEFMECEELVTLAKAMAEYILDWDEDHAETV